MQFLVQAEALRGKYGLAVQAYTCMMIFNYVCAFIIVSTSLLEKRLPSSAKDARTLAKIMMVAFLQPITGTALLYFRCRGEPCNPSMTLKEFYFCNSASNGLVPSDGFIGWLVFSIIYQLMMPVRFAWTLLAWFIGLAGVVLSVHSAVTGSGIHSALAGNSVLLGLYVLFLLLQYALEKRSMRDFLLTESKADVINLGDHEEYRKFVEISDSLQWGASFFEPLWGAGGSAAPSAAGSTPAETNAILFQRDWTQRQDHQLRDSAGGGDTSSTSSLTDSFAGCFPVDPSVCSAFSFSDSNGSSIKFEEALGSR